VQQVRIAPAKTASNCGGLGFHPIHEAISYGVHATRIYGAGNKKDAGRGDILIQQLKLFILSWIPIAEIPALESGEVAGEPPITRVQSTTSASSTRSCSR